MNGFQMKVLACACMFIDHVGVIFFPQEIFLRVIGRLSFPLFAWLLATGFLHTRNVFRYLRRLIFCAVLLQIPYSAYFKDFYLNIFFTLFLGLAAIYLYRATSNQVKGFGAVFLIALFSELIQADYGFYGVLSIFLFYFFYTDFKKMVLSQGLLNMVDLGLAAFAAGWRLSNISSVDLVQPFSLGALFFIFWYNGQRGRNLKYTFYIFYPAHLVFLYGIKLLLAY
ncbi:TraX family protein [Candidatus Formimonas warabiya]|uniref:TraX protein n=1 Tax=Formimonas warabiya TaxID=1761012 RepID=A0A3G1KUE3_FORW1|nr:TraX family protein [Candidatus Formimonas warabiya]ATW26050.1 hypothetical protein DCMF_15855 [Candidatus Formimonas warabiya]